MRAVLELTVKARGTRKARTYTAHRHFGMWWSRYGVRRNAREMLAVFDRRSGITEPFDFETLSGKVSALMPDGSKVTTEIDTTLDEAIDVVERMSDGR